MRVSQERIDDWMRPVTDLDYSNVCYDIRSVQIKREDSESAIANEKLE